MSPMKPTESTTFANLMSFFCSAFHKGSLITLTSVKLKNFDELFRLIFPATESQTQDNWDGNTKEEDTDTTFKIRYEDVRGTETSLDSVKNNCFPASS